MNLTANHFKENQLQFERVSNAYHEKGAFLQDKLIAKGFNNNFELLLTTYKQEQLLKIWLKNIGESNYQLFETYDFAVSSGVLGPKTEEGDQQIPEGIYEISVFNPLSKYHLSLGINYPNATDLQREENGNKLGGQIYLHGGAESKGCIAITDDKIKIVYILAVEAKKAGQKTIPIYMMPFEFTEENMEFFVRDFPQHQNFWNTLKTDFEQLALK